MKNLHTYAIHFVMGSFLLLSLIACKKPSATSNNANGAPAQQAESDAGVFEIRREGNDMVLVAYHEDKWSTELKKKAIVIPDNVTRIADGVFSGDRAKNLFQVQFANASQLKKIGKKAFSDMPNLVQIALPFSLTEVCDSAFSGSKKLSKIFFGPTPPTLQNGVFDKAGTEETYNRNDFGLLKQIPPAPEVVTAAKDTIIARMERLGKPLTEEEKNNLPQQLNLLPVRAPLSETEKSKISFLAIVVRDDGQNTLEGYKTDESWKKNIPTSENENTNVERKPELLTDKQLTESMAQAKALEDPTILQLIQVEDLYIYYIIAQQQAAQQQGR